MLRSASEQESSASGSGISSVVQLPWKHLYSYHGDGGVQTHFTMGSDYK